MLLKTASSSWMLIGIVDDDEAVRRVHWQPRPNRLQQAFDQLRALSSRLQSIREEERKRIAREIHDELGQALTAIKIGLSSLTIALPEEQRPSKRAESLIKLGGQTIEMVGRISGVRICDASIRYR